MAYRKKHKSMDREKRLMEYEDEEGFKMEESKPTNHDYITLKNKSTKNKTEN